VHKSGIRLGLGYGFDKEIGKYICNVCDESFKDHEKIRRHFRILLLRPIPPPPLSKIGAIILIINSDYSY